MTNHNGIVYDVVSALAKAEDVPPLELDYSLADYIDPSLLETIVSREHDCELTFQVPDHEVTVTATSEISLDGTPIHQASNVHSAFTIDTDLMDQSKFHRLQRFFENLPCTVYQSRNEAGWPIEFISENCRELTGYDPNAFVVGGVNFGFDLIHSADRDKVSHAVSESIQNEEPFSVQYRLLTADNEEKSVRELGIALVEEETEPIPIVGAIIDETDLTPDHWETIESASPLTHDHTDDDLE